MAKLTLADIISGFGSIGKLNANFADIEAIFERVVFRDGTAPNQMTADFDMNGRRILNLAAPQSGSDAARLSDITSGVVSITNLVAPTQSGHVGHALTTDGSTIAWTALDLAGTGISGNLPVTRLGSGTGATNRSFWRGDGVWAELPATFVTNPFVTLTDDATVVLNATLGDKFIVTLGGNRTLSITNPVDGQSIELWTVQDGTGARTLAWPGNVVFETGATPTLTSAAAARDRFQLTYNLARNEWVARTSISAAGSVVLSVNEANVRLFERLGSPAGVVTVNVTVPAGVIISSDTTVTAALDLAGFASGSTVNITNLGLIVGKGGRGGDGGYGAALDGDDRWYGPGRTGRAGGNAINGPGPGRTFNLTNANGRIWGGGGGGGGGGLSFDSTGMGLAAAGGGGGAGAGAAEGGEGGSGLTVTVGVAGSNSGTGLNGALGAGGAGGQTAGNASGGAGGAGGDFGAAGSAGSAPTSFADDIGAGSGGAAGKAIELNGGTINIVSGSGSPNVKGAVS